MFIDNSFTCWEVDIEDLCYLNDGLWFIIIERSYIELFTANIFFRMLESY